jgi:hypothetical protein
VRVLQSSLDGRREREPTAESLHRPRGQLPAEDPDVLGEVTAGDELVLDGVGVLDDSEEPFDDDPSDDDPSDEPVDDDPLALELVWRLSVR